MKLNKISSNKAKFTLSKKDWLRIGQKFNWLKKAQDADLKEWEEAEEEITEEVKEVEQPTLPPTGWSPKSDYEEQSKDSKEEIVKNIRASFETAHTKYGDINFLILANTGPQIAPDLKKLGFKAFKDRSTGEWTWSMNEKNARNKRTLIESFGIDTACLDQPPKEKVTTQTIADIPQQEEVNIEDLDLPEEFIMWHNEMEAASQLSVQERKKKYNAIVQDVLDKIGEDVESAEAQEQSQAILKALLSASGKFHNYSFNNSIMIQLMKPGAEYVASEANWKRMGRVPKPGITKVPVTFRYTKKIENEKDQGEEAEERVISRFGLGTTIAYEDTMPIPGWEKDGEGPFEPPEWQINSNEATEWLTQLYDAAYKWGTEVKQFRIQSDPIGHSMGGYAQKGGLIVINDKYDGVKKVSVLFHELAHQLIHFDPDFKREESTKQEREADAEATSYVVASHYHIENKDTKIYLAGHKVSRTLLKNRLEHIQKAAIEMFEGIDAIMQQMNLATGNIDQEVQAVTPDDFSTPDRQPNTAPPMANLTSSFYGSLGLNKRAKKATAFIWDKEEFTADMFLEDK